MTYRIVTGTIYKTTDRPWSNAPICIKRSKGTFTPKNYYPKDIIYCQTDSQGRLTYSDGDSAKTMGVPLWCNEEGIEPTFYECILPDEETFSFSLPVGSEDIDLAILKSVGVTQIKNKVKRYFSFGDASPIIVLSKFTGTIYSASMVVSTVFDGNILMSLIDTTTNITLFNLDKLAASYTGQYQYFPNHECIDADIALKITIDNTTTQGTGFVLIET